MPAHRSLTTIVGLVLGLAALLGLGAGLAHAQNITSGDNLTVPANRTIDGTYIAGGRSIDIGGTVNGDVICGAQTLDISGTVNGDVICGAQTVTISGRVDGDVRLGAQTVTLSGPVTGNASIAAQTLNLGGGSTIGGDISYAGSSLNSNGQIGRDLAMAVETATIAGAVGRNVNATVQRLTISGGADINGTVNYTSNNKATVASGAQVGSITQRQPPERDQKQQDSFKRWALLFGLLWTLAVLFGSLVLILLLPRFFYATSEETLARPGWTILAGLIAGIALPALIIMAFVTVIGIPLGIMLILLSILLSMLSFPVAAFFLGRWLFGRQLQWSDNAIILMLLGAAVLVILFWIPIIDIITWFLMIWVGYGSIFGAFRHRYKRPEYQVPRLKAASAPVNRDRN